MRAETIKGTLVYRHLGTNSVWPVLSDRVEIWRMGPEPFFTPIATTSTGTMGYFSVEVGVPQLPIPPPPPWPLPPPPPPPLLPNAVTKSWYQVVVFAQTGDVMVLTENVTPLLPGLPFSDQAGGIQVATSPNDVLRFDYEFSSWGSKHFWPVHVIKYARAFANAHRDDTDQIPQAIIQLVDLSDPGITFYDPVQSVVRFGRDYYFSDWTLAHEYGHFLEHKISTFLPYPSSHLACTTQPYANGPLVNAAEFAWMEGFPSWFVTAVDSQFPGQLAGWGLRPGYVGTTNPQTAENWSATNCAATVGQMAQPIPGVTGTHAIDYTMFENTVVALLLDLADPNQSTETWEQSEGTADTIFKIFDREMDVGSGYPGIMDFYSAWVARGMDVGRAERIMANLGVPWTTLERATTLGRNDFANAMSRNAWGGVGVFHRGTDFGLYGVYQGAPGGAFGGWFWQGADVWSTPVTAFVPQGIGVPAAVHAFYRDGNYHIQHTNIAAGGIPGAEVATSLGALPDLPLPPGMGGAANPILGNPVVLVGPGGLIQVFIRRLDGRVFRTAQATLGGSFPSWTDLGGVATTGLAGAVSQSGRTEIFDIGTDHKLYRCVNPTTSCGWQPVGSEQFSSVPTAIARSGVDTLVVCAANGVIPRCAEQTSPGSGYGSFVSVSLTAGPASAMSGMAFGGQGVSLFYTSSYGGAVTRVDQVSPGQSWTAVNMGGTSTSAVSLAVDSTGKRFAAVRNGANGISVIGEGSGGWGGWSNLGGVAMGFSTNAVGDPVDVTLAPATSGGAQ